MQRRVPGLLAGPLLKQESYRTSLCLAVDGSRRTSACSDTAVRALDHAKAVLAEGNENQRVPFEIAAIYATHGDNAAALEWLEKAQAAGYCDYATLARHPIFERLRREPRFQAVLATMEKRVASMRDRSTVLAELRTLPFPEAAPTSNPPSAR